MAELLKGAPVAKHITEELVERVQVLKNKGVIPCLAIVRAGDDPSDISYETGATKRCEKIGIEVRKYILSADAGVSEISSVIDEINNDASIHGCLLCRPLKNKDAELAACRMLDPSKDADCMTESALGAVFTGSANGYAPCTAQSCMEILKYYDIPLKGKNVVVAGRSSVIGKPVSQMLLSQDATVTVCHSKSIDIPKICKGADILIAAVGKAKFFGSDSIAPGQIVIDVGINTDENGNLCGDVDFDAAEPVVSGITPVPGGVGAVTTAVLAKHVTEAAEKTI